MAKFKAGDLVAITTRTPGTTPPYDLPVGTIAKVVAVHTGLGDTHYDLDLDPATLARVRRFSEEETSVSDARLDSVVAAAGLGWNTSWLDAAPAGAVFGEATIDWSGSKKATAREYADHLDSRVLDERTRITLNAIAAGEVTTVAAANAAVTRALSSISTRFGQSAKRREYTSKARHLHYIVQGSLTNALDGLPPIEPGARSPRIKALEEQVETLRREVANAEQKRDLFDRNGAALAEEVDRLKAEAALAKDNRRRERRDVAEERAALKYALTLLDDDQHQRVVGFRAGWKAARS